MGAHSSLCRCGEDRGLPPWFLRHLSQSPRLRPLSSPSCRALGHEADMWPHYPGRREEGAGAVFGVDDHTCRPAAIGVCPSARPSQQAPANPCVAGSSEQAPSPRAGETSAKAVDGDAACLPFAWLFRPVVLDRQRDTQALAAVHLDAQGADGDGLIRASSSLDGVIRTDGEHTLTVDAMGHRSSVCVCGAKFRTDGHRAELHRWIDGAASSLCKRRDSPTNVFNVGRTTDSLLEASAFGLTTLAECYLPVFAELQELIGYSARDFVALCGTASKTINTQSGFEKHSMWELMYLHKWPSFHTCLKHQGVQDWRKMYGDTFGGRVVCTLEIFDREKKLGFAMAAMAADVRYEAQTDTYCVRYISANEVLPETVPIFEGHRLRYCPPSVHARLQPRCFRFVCPSARQQKMPLWDKECYPFKVLEGFEGLVVGAGCELQWKMQQGSPFGWWYGHLEQLELEADGTTAIANITFRHFPEASRWYRLQVRFGDSTMRDCMFGGFTGGIRGVTDTECKHWMTFFPKHPVVF